MNSDQAYMYTFGAFDKLKAAENINHKMCEDMFLKDNRINALKVELEMKHADVAKLNEEIDRLNKNLTTERDSNKQIEISRISKLHEYKKESEKYKTLLLEAENSKKVLTNQVVLQCQMITSLNDENQQLKLNNNPNQINQQSINNMGRFLMNQFSNETSTTSTSISSTKIAYCEDIKNSLNDLKQNLFTLRNEMKDYKASYSKSFKDILFMCSNLRHEACKVTMNLRTLDQDTLDEMMDAYISQEFFKEEQELFNEFCSEVTNLADSMMQDIRSL